tara:strand:+ start:160 stop:411 length:252 start_codon:yes stop_codon:yes gene_type:complete
MSKKTTKIKQANMQSDQLEMGFSQGITYGGDTDSAFSYSFGDLGELSFPEEDMREKYPALKQAWEHYQSVLEVCKTKEQEDED